MSAASKVRREDPKREIVVFERSPHTSYSACGMPYFIAGLVDGPEKLVARSPEKFRETYNIDARTGHEVTELDLTNQRVRVRNLSDASETWEAYDQLLIATGAEAILPRLDNSDADGIFGLSTLASGIRIQQFMDQQLPRRAVVVGGGFPLRSPLCGALDL
ncbi:FAD-dependent oxidoreductase [Trichlorobacter lovleyi]